MPTEYFNLGFGNILLVTNKEMNMDRVKRLSAWFISTTALASIVLSVFLLFSTGVKAACDVSATCPNGGSVSCSGSTCTGYGLCVKCKTDGAEPVTTCCPGGDS